MKRKMISSILCAALAASLLAGYGSCEAAALDESEEFTLRLMGPGLLGTQGENGALDMVTGLETPGYNVIIDRWEELHPNVKLEIENAPWDSWQSAVQAAVLSGDVDVVLHGATLTALVEPLDEYLAADPEYAEQIYTTETRRTTDINDLTVATTTGIPYTLSPMICYLDKQIFEDYGIELPDENWTWSDMLSLAQQMTGTDPVTGKQTYGVQVDSMDNANNAFFTFQMVASAYDAQIFTYGKTVEDSTVDYTSEKAIKVFQMIKDLGECCSPTVREGVNVAYQLTAENDTAIRYSQNVFTHFNEAKVGEVEDRFVFMPVPVIEEGEHAGDPSSFKGCNNMAICNTSEHKDWAWEFIKFMSTDPVAVQWVIDCGQIPNVPEGLDTVREIMGDKADAISRTLETMPNEFSNSSTAYYNNINFGPVTATLGSVTLDLVKGTTTAEEAGQTMQTTIEEFLASK